MSKVETDVSSAISDGKEKLEGSSSMASSSSAAAAAAAADEWATRLVNAANPLPEDFSVKTVDIEGYENRPFDARAATALEEMLADAEAAGNKLYLVSGYRSVARQKACLLYTSLVKAMPAMQEALCIFSRARRSPLYDFSR